ncbi:MAG TPA: PRC-barrel domain-containing protein [Candidatus Limnocylindrales bacterium]|nr:PRC-barrel domain-containing protein [Candidatus Limnocylindrales bacterium]
MRKGKKLIGKPVLSLGEGLKVGEVKDVVLGRDNDMVVGLLVDEGGLFGSAQVIPIEEIEAFGRDAVVVTDRDSIRAAGEVPEIKAILDRHTSLIGTKVYTETGDHQGSINDVYFEESTGRVTALEVTGGTWQDATKGVRNLPVSEVVRTGPEILYVHPETADVLEQQRGGITGALADAGDKAKDAGSKAADKAKEAGSAVGDKAADAGDSIGDTAGELRPEDQLIGKRTAEDVDDDRGAVIVPAGRRVTEDDVERAKAAGKTAELARSVGMEAFETGRADLADAAGNAGDKAASLWDQFTRKLGEMTDATGKRIDEEQTKGRLSKIEDAVGRPVTKAILDLQDNVILDVGDLVTHAAVQRAHDAGSLDSLLGSVYHAEVTFEKEELKARKPGEATLERAAGEGAPVVEEMKGKVEQAEAEREASAEESKAKAEREREDRERERETKARDREQAASSRKRERATASSTRAGVSDATDDPGMAATEAGAADGEEVTQAFRAVGPGRPAGVER